MQQVLTSTVAVLGTLLGAYMTYVFQRRNAQRISAESDMVRRRQEFVEAMTAYAAAAAALRRAEFDRCNKRLKKAPSADYERARQETYRLRSEARSAYYRLWLIADPVRDVDLVQHADDAIEATQRISSASNSELEMHRYGDAAAKALANVVNEANRRLHGG
ncbi:hypothetical protein [Mycolicibacterium fortuitum]|uniref:hypothetical protein n=1 Tax=Mycolicibacterium fortuitum TaxID=1766 RepID=UPI000A5DD126|nr:hypothetical protein [Mycolicibacterium fortuitum]